MHDSLLQVLPVSLLGRHLTFFLYILFDPTDPGIADQSNPSPPSSGDQTLSPANYRIWNFPKNNKIMQLFYFPLYNFADM
jgi:hypothetical protein